MSFFIYNGQKLAQQQLIRMAGGAIENSSNFSGLRLDDEAFIKTSQPYDGVRSVFGTEVVGYVCLRAQPYKDHRGETLQPPPPMMLRTAIVNARLQKNIVKTAIQGRPGTIKEFVSSGDYDITIKAIVTTTESVYEKTPPDAGYPVYERENLMPGENMALISNWVETDAVIEIENQYLNHLGINDIIIEGFYTQQVKGKPNQFEFELHCVSERFQDLVIIDAAERGIVL